MTIIRTGALSLLVLLSLTACGGSSSGDATPTAAAVPSPAPSVATTGGVDDAIAASMLITRSDVPRDYLEKKKTADDTAMLAEACGRSEQRGVTGRAVGDDFLFDGQTPAVSEVVTVFASESEAATSIAGVPDYVTCALAAIADGAINSPGVEFSPATSEPVDVATGADESHAVQITAAKTVQGQSLPVVMQYTIVFARKGRVVYEVTSRGPGEPMDPEEMAAFAEGAASRIRQE